MNAINDIDVIIRRIAPPPSSSPLFAEIERSRRLFDDLLRPKPVQWVRLAPRHRVAPAAPPRPIFGFRAGRRPSSR